MIKINLLPIRQIKKRQKLLKEVCLFGVSLVALLAVLGLAALALGSKVDGLQSEISALQKKKASYQPIIAKIEKLKKDKAALEAKLASIKKLKKGSQITVRLLDEIAALTPSNRLWLNSLQQSSGKLTLTGVALDNATIAQYMEGLRASPYFAETDLASTSLSQVAGRKLKNFSLTLLIAEPEATENGDQQQDSKKK